MPMLLSVLLTIHLAATAGEVIVKIPPGINLREQEVRTDLPAAIPTRGGYDRIEIVIYYFSQGIEQFSYGDNNTMKESMTKGEMKALLKLKRKNVLRKALFVEAAGTSREQIIRAFHRTVSDTLARQ